MWYLYMNVFFFNCRWLFIYSRVALILLLFLMWSTKPVRWRCSGSAGHFRARPRTCSSRTVHLRAHACGPASWSYVSPHCSLERSLSSLDVIGVKKYRRNDKNVKQQRMRHLTKYPQQTMWLYCMLMQRVCTWQKRKNNKYIISVKKPTFFPSCLIVFWNDKNSCNVHLRVFLFLLFFCSHTVCVCVLGKPS